MANKISQADLKFIKKKAKPKAIPKKKRRGIRAGFNLDFGFNI